MLVFAHVVAITRNLSRVSASSSECQSFIYYSVSYLLIACNLLPVFFRRRRPPPLICVERTRSTLWESITDWGYDFDGGIRY